MNKLLALAGVLLIIVTGAGAVGLLNGGATSGKNSGPSVLTLAPVRAATVPISGFAFKTVKLVVSVGGRVTWTNDDSAPHTATADQGPSFDTGTLMQHQSKTITFRTAGTFTYHCAFHPFMQASVTVR